MKILKWYPHVRYSFIVGNVTFAAFKKGRSHTVSAGDVMRRDPRERDNANANKAKDHSPVAQIVCACHDVVHVANKAGHHDQCYRGDWGTSRRPCSISKSIMTKKNPVIM